MVAIMANVFNERDIVVHVYGENDYNNIKSEAPALKEIVIQFNAKYETLIIPSLFIVHCQTRNEQEKIIKEINSYFYEK